MRLVFRRDARTLLADEQAVVSIFMRAMCEVAVQLGALNHKFHRLLVSSSKVKAPVR